MQTSCIHTSPLQQAEAEDANTSSASHGSLAPVSTTAQYASARTILVKAPCFDQRGWFYCVWGRHPNQLHCGCVRCIPKHHSRSSCPLVWLASRCRHPMRQRVAAENATARTATAPQAACNLLDQWISLANVLLSYMCYGCQGCGCQVATLCNCTTGSKLQVPCSMGRAISASWTHGGSWQVSCERPSLRTRAHGPAHTHSAAI